MNWVLPQSLPLLKVVFTEKDEGITITARVQLACPVCQAVTEVMIGSDNGVVVSETHIKGAFIVRARTNSTFIMNSHAIFLSLIREITEERVCENCGVSSSMPKRFRDSLLGCEMYVKRDLIVAKAKDEELEDFHIA